MKNNRLHKLYRLMAEREGFEPSDPFGVGGFRIRCLQPLDHLSSYI